MQLVSTVTVGAGGASTIQFTSIPQTGTDLLLICSLRGASDTTYTANIRLNGDSANNYTNRVLQGDGSAASSAGYTWSGYQVIAGASNSTASTFGNAALIIPNYSTVSTKVASSDSVSENNATLSYQSIGAHRWSGTAAVTSLSISFATGVVAQHSTASLYIITKA